VPGPLLRVAYRPTARPPGAWLVGREAAAGRACLIVGSRLPVLVHEVVVDPRGPVDRLYMLGLGGNGGTPWPVAHQVALLPAGPPAALRVNFATPRFSDEDKCSLGQRGLILSSRVLLIVAGRRGRPAREVKR
jgi:hypothetical protein